jgi:hypothetical protein
MSKRKPPREPVTAKPPSTPTYSVTNCSIVNSGPATNEHTRAAIEALAAAAKANAEAIAEIAKALTGSPATMDTGIRLGPS